MDIVSRLKKYMEHVELPISQFADVALIPRPTLSQILSGRNKKISNELMSKLHTAFPNLNISWLLFGDGPMEIGGEAPIHAPRPMIAQEAATKDMGLFDEIDDEVKAHIPTPNQPIAVSPDSNKRVQSIMVFYSDNSFEIFTPSQR